MSNEKTKSYDTADVIAMAFERMTSDKDAEIERLQSALATARAKANWQPIEIEPTDKFVLMAGVNSEGIAWRDVGVYRGTDEAGRCFVDKYGSTSYPTHWMPLPAAPAELLAVAVAGEE